MSEADVTARELVIYAFQKAKPKDSAYLERLLTDWLGLHGSHVHLTRNKPVSYVIRVADQTQAQRLTDNFGGVAKAHALGWTVTGYCVDLTS